MTNILSSLTKINQKKKKRVGRGLGSGKGSKSGRGTTRHQKARESIPLHFEGGQGRYVKKFPLWRGKGRNKPLKKPAFIIHLKDLNVFKDGDTIDIQSLIKKKLLIRKEEVKTLKVLASGTLERKLIVKLPVSQAVKKQIEKLGGEVKLV
ncbi:50S ribosomal protein L15 [Candidatus Roizmanbacteria bacterium RIFCSPLOWO2_01_FULL_41_22]|uniref:Large ribosomal subunit protein uL15 n=2 Tax=Candidatus Roizmaniibacteriota TaxID=1752723 RepID=A0A1F7JQ22_9BACT|nr:MAG: 50S ribosomal protein L15 [Candidatus Roizmanbacteria bacterium RIFCSPLOWO2_01_FULL_41_22]OGK57710.1 MAG: 50S ribosomal protein L15 [Candidatus Roizmanbacteria bacterium RIFCSPLOWO2_02_FULL_41_9]